jgi:quercetin dioxygenase-like cupin family protein
MTLSPYVAQATDHQHLGWLGGSTIEILVDSVITDGQVLIMRADSTRGNGVPVHVHTREDEIFVLLEGTLVVWVGEERREVGPGAVAFLPRDVPHAYVVTSETAKILEIVAPAGLEQAFRAVGWDLSSPPPEGWLCTPDAVAQAMSKIGCRILGPPKHAEDGPMTDPGAGPARRVDS